MQKKLLSLSFLLALIWPCSAILNSCNPANCKPRQCTYVSSLDVKVVDNGDSIPHDVTNSELYAKALMMQITITNAFTTDSLWLCPHVAMNSPFISTASAIYKKECDETGARDLLDTFRITSNHDFDAAHPAGTDLQDIFYSSSPIKNYNGNSWGSSTQGLYTYYMRQEPADTGTHVFTVRMHFTNGKVLSQSTAPVKLLK